MAQIDSLRGHEERSRVEASFRAHYPDILAFALRRQPDRQAAEDAAAETFAVAWRRRASIPDPPLPWLYGVALRVLANQRRASKRRRGLEERAAADRTVAACADDPVETIDRRQRFHAAFAHLADEDKEVLRLIAWEGLDPRECAVVLGCSYGAVRVRLHRTRRRLRKQLDAAGHSADEHQEQDAELIEERP